MKTHTTKAFVIPAAVWLGSALVAGFMVLVPNARPWNLFHKDQVATASADLAKAQAETEKAKLEAKMATDALNSAQAALLAKKDSQIGYAQQMASGASESLKKATPEPAVTLAVALLDRTNTGLAAAIGQLPADKQAEIVKIVSDSLSGVQERLNDANARLVAKDKELSVATTERDAIKAQIPQLQAKLTEKDALVVSSTQIAAQKTELLVSAAEKAEAKVKESGSLLAQVNSLGRWLIIIGIAWLVKDLVLPSLAQEFPGAKAVVWLNKTVKSITSAHA